MYMDWKKRKVCNTDVLYTAVIAHCGCVSGQGHCGLQFPHTEMLQLNQVVLECPALHGEKHMGTNAVHITHILVGQALHLKKDIYTRKYAVLDLLIYWYVILVQTSGLLFIRPQDLVLNPVSRSRTHIERWNKFFILLMCSQDLGRALYCATKGIQWAYYFPQYFWTYLSKQEGQENYVNGAYKLSPPVAELYEGKCE